MSCGIGRFGGRRRGDGGDVGGGCALVVAVVVAAVAASAEFCKLCTRRQLGIASIQILSRWHRCAREDLYALRPIASSPSHKVAPVILPILDSLTIFRLTTGHCQLLCHLHRLKISHSDECPCGTGLQTPQPHPAVLPYLRRFETPDMTQAGGCSLEALGTG